MDLIRSYSHDSSEEDSLQGTNEAFYLNDYLGLSSDELDDQLDQDVENDLAALKAAVTVHENSFLLSPNVCGPSESSKTDEVHPSEYPSTEIVIRKEHVRDSDKLSNVQINNAPHESNSEVEVCWENVFETRIAKDRRCRPPAGCTFIKKLSDKCISSVEWNKSFCSLLLTTSLDGYLRIWNYASRSLLCSRIVHQGGIRAGTWSLDGKAILTGGFDKHLRLSDLVTGLEVSSYSHRDMVSSVCSHPSDPNLILSGTFNCVCAWDVRSPTTTPVRSFCANCKQVLCLCFLPNEEEFVSSTEVVSRDSADRTIMVWHFASGALLSNQIYQERFVCPWLCVDYQRNNFLAQSSGNYIAEFSALQPYKMNKYKRYEGHNVSGYSICCCLSHDQSLLASGDSSGGLCVYRVNSASLVQRLNCPSGDPSVSLDWHPHLGALLAVGTWNGSLQFWN